MRKEANAPQKRSELPIGIYTTYKRHDPRESRSPQSCDENGKLLEMHLIKLGPLIKLLTSRCRAFLALVSQVETRCSHAPRVCQAKMPEAPVGPSPFSHYESMMRRDWGGGGGLA